MRAIVADNFEEQRKPEIVIVPATAEHIRDLMENLRDADRKEIESFGMSANKGLWRSFKNGLMNKAAFIDGKLAAVWGVGGVYMGAKGQPWLMTTPEVKKISPLRFARIYQREALDMLQMFEMLENYVAQEYNEAIRLLMICGFNVEEPEKIGQGMYRRFWRVA